MLRLTKVFHRIPEETRNNKACAKCMEEKSTVYSEKFPKWNQVQREKYAKYKCSLRRGGTDKPPCSAQPLKRIESKIMHVLVVILLIAFFSWLVLL